MSNFGDRVAAVRPHLRFAWDEARAEAALKGVRRRQRRRVVVRAVAGGLAVVAVAVGLGARREHAVVASASIASAAMVAVAGASTATPIDPATELAPTRSDPASAVYELARGVVRCETSRSFLEIASGEVRVDATDASFVVSRADAAATVTVTRGSVRILWALGESDLGAGESGTFPPPAVAPPASALPSSVASASSPPAPAGSSDWRGFARDGDFDRAYAALGAQGGAPVKDEAGDLLLAADVARMSHHAAQAVDPLQRVIRGHRADPRAPLAAFTLGRVLLDELGRPREAADAFADAQALAPGGPLAEDALAREVEAASRAGDATRAHDRAEQYATRYPNGARIRSVRRYGGLD